MEQIISESGIVYSSQEMRYLIEGEYYILYILIFALCCYLAHLFCKFFKQFLDL